MQKCQFGQDLGGPVNLQHAIAKCKEANISHMILDQIKEDGLGSDLATEA